MLFTSLSLLLWNYLLYVSRCVPRAISIWGLIAICLLTIAVLLVLYDQKFRKTRLQCYWPSHTLHIDCS